MHVSLIIAASILSSVGLIMTNKAIMRVHGFTYVFTLTTSHFLFTYVSLGTLAAAGVFKPKKMPPRENWTVAALGVASIVFMNLSLRNNSVGFYQVTKLMTIPCLVAIQTVYYGQQFSNRIKLSLAVLLAGVGVATVTDVELNSMGSIFGTVAVLSTAQFQIWQGAKQKEYGLNPLQINHSLSPLQGTLAGILALLIDCQGEDAVQYHEFTLTEISLIALSCLLAVSVNLCSFGLIGKTSAVTYQVVGHAKTCLILIFGFILYPVDADSGQLLRNIAGIVVAMAGVITYGRVKQLEGQQQKRQSASIAMEEGGKEPGDQEPLVRDQATPKAVR